MKSSITKQILTVLLFILILFLGYISFGHSFTKDTKSNINNIKTNNVPTLLLDIDNLKLIREVTMLFSDIAITGENILIDKIYIKQKNIKKNLQKISEINNKNHEELILLLDKYILNSKEFIELILNDKYDVDYAANINILKNKLIEKFTNKKNHSEKLLNEELFHISYSVEDFFKNSQIISIIILIVLLVFIFLMTTSIKKKFAEISEAMQNLITKKPDFSKRLIINQNNELQDLATLFNTLTSKFEKIYNESEMLKQKAQETAKLKSEFLANMSHEIRTPLNGIIGFSELLSQNNLSTQNKEYNEKILKSSNLLLKIVNDILDLSKIEAKKIILEKKNFNITETLNNVIDILSLKAKDKNINIKTNININENQNHIGDQLRVYQILVNLIGNSIKFTKNGVIEVTINQKDNDFIQFIVKDSGIGIEKNKQKTLFEPFTQADSSTTRKYGGTGLGLTLCKELIELMDGDIYIESQVNQGASFIFKIKLQKTEILQKNINNVKNKESVNEFCDIMSNIDKDIFNNLKLAIESRRPLRCKQAIHDIEKINMSENQRVLFDKLKYMVLKYQFKEAEELL